MVPGGRVLGVSVLLMAMVMRQEDRGPLWTSLLISASKGRWPPSCSATWTPFTHCRHREIWGGVSRPEHEEGCCHFRHSFTERYLVSYHLPHQPDNRNGAPMEIRQPSPIQDTDPGVGNEYFPHPPQEARCQGTVESQTPQGSAKNAQQTAPAHSPCLLLAALTTMA